MPCGFESHLSHQISPNPFWDLEIFLFARERGLERPLRKHAGGMFLATDRSGYAARREDVGMLGS